MTSQELLVEDIAKDVRAVASKYIGMIATPELESSLRASVECELHKFRNMGTIRDFAVNPGADGGKMNVSFTLCPTADIVHMQVLFGGQMLAVEPTDWPAENNAIRIEL